MNSGRAVLMMWIIFSPVLLVVAYPIVQDLRLHGALTSASTAMLIFAAFFTAIVISVTVRWATARRRTRS